MDDIRKILEKLTAPAQIICEECWNEDSTFLLDAAHILNTRATTAPELPSQQLTQFLQLHDGAIFFATDGDDPEFPVDAGLQILPAESIAVETTETLALIEEGMSMDPEMTDELEAETRQYLAGLVVIGAPVASGDSFALDTSSMTNGEPRVILLDHEYFFGGSIGPDLIEKSWTDFNSFLLHLAESPEEVLLSSWRVDNPATGEQSIMKGVQYR